MERVDRGKLIILILNYTHRLIYADYLFHASFFFFFFQEQLIPECPATRVKIRATLGWSHIWMGHKGQMLGSYVLWEV